MASPNERKLRKLVLKRKIEELNGTAAASTVVGAVVDVVEVVEDVVEDVIDVVEDVVDEIVEVVYPKGKARKK